MTILIAGANGQVGHELRLRAGADAVALDRNQLDITQAGAVQEALLQWGPQVVINAAAYTAVDKAEQEPEQAFAVNGHGPMYLAQACRSRGIPLLHLSTDYVFDGKKAGPYLEGDTTSPVGIYAQSKWMGEQKIREALPRHLILRVSWVFGDHGNNFVKTILRLARERPELRVIADQHGCPTSAASIAVAILTLAKRAQHDALPWGTYHYTGTPATTWHGFATAIVEEAKRMGMIASAPPVRPLTTAEYPLPAARPANSLLDCNGSEQKLGLVRSDWRHDLRDVLHTLKQHQP